VGERIGLGTALGAVTGLIQSRSRDLGKSRGGNRTPDPLITKKLAGNVVLHA
jgi:hypothetical protein